jgi:hypothetical protein
MHTRANERDRFAAATRTDVAVAQDRHGRKTVVHLRDERHRRHTGEILRFEDERGHARELFVQQCAALVETRYGSESRESAQRARQSRLIAAIRDQPDDGESFLRSARFPVV